MDEAWKLEQELWTAIAAGSASSFYSRHMTADGFAVVPGAVHDRHELITRWTSHEPLRAYELSEPRLVMVDGESVLVHYRVTCDADWLPDYRARVTSLYTWSGNGWAMAFRQHTPDPDQTFPF